MSVAKLQRRNLKSRGRRDAALEKEKKMPGARICPTEEAYMSKKMGIVLAALFFIATASLSLLSQEQKGIEGIWEGVLKIREADVRIVFKINKKTDGALTAVMDSPDQGAMDIPLDTVTFDNGSLRIELKAAQASYEGKMSEDGSEIEGAWKQGGVSLPLVLKRTDKAPELKRPQEPKKPYPYDEEEVSYENARGGIKLAAALTLPRVKGPVPAVVFITGSGAQDRNETVFGHKPFLVLAEFLTRHGIATLRANDRGVGGTTGNIEEATSDDFAYDALAGLEYLKSRREINPKHIGLIGHSEGGIIAPIAAVKSSDVAFIVLMAGSGLTGEQVVYLQGALIAKANGASEERIEKNLAIQKRIFRIASEEKDIAVAEEKLRQLVPEMLAMLSDEEKEAMGGDIDKLIREQTKRLISPWFRYFLAYDPKTSLRKVKCPVLAINGELDLQVPFKENLEAIEGALKEGGNKDYTIKAFPKLNHLFQPASTGSPSEYVKIEATISPEVLKFIGDWILEKTKE